MFSVRHYLTPDEHDILGTGYRVYYAMSSAMVILLLCGGDKDTQNADIERAIAYWKDWQRIAKNARS